MSWLWDDRLVEVWAWPGEAGSGVATGSRGVLTARHVVAQALGDYQPRRMLARLVRRDEARSPWVAVRVVADDPDWDLAVLEVDPDEPGPESWAAPSSLSPTLADVGTAIEKDCEAVGFPDENLQRTGSRNPADTVRQSEQISATLLPMGQAKPPVTPLRSLPKGWMPLDADSSTPSDQDGWGGMSGAGVLLPDGRLVGLLVTAESARQERRLYMVPLARAIGASSCLSQALSSVTGTQVVVEPRSLGASPGMRATWRIRPSLEGLPALSPRFVAQDHALKDVRRKLVDLGGGPVVGIAAMGGAGKSMLARALVHDPLVRESFPDGIVWVDVNPDPDPVRVVSEVLKAFGDFRPVQDTITAGQRLRTLLSGARCLIVLDDVSNIDVLDAVRVPAGVRMLVTTRIREALYSDSVVYRLKPASANAARRMLAAYAGQRVDELPEAADDVLKRCGGLPLALALTGSMVSSDWDWPEVADALDAGDQDSLAGRFEDGYRYRNLLAALDASVRLLQVHDADRFRELAIFKGRGPVPIDVVSRLWKASNGTTERQCKQLLRRLSNLSLVQIGWEKSRTVSTHDLLFDYARVTLPEGRFGELHALLASDFLDRWGGISNRLPTLRNIDSLGEADRYGISAVVDHLLAAGRYDVLDNLLEVDWSTGPGRTDNVWYTVHEDLGWTTDYLAEIRAIRLDAQGQEPGHISNTLIRQIFCALIIGSLASIAENIPPVVLCRLVEVQIWPVSRALAYAQSIPDPENRVQALIGLVCYLPEDARGPILAQAVAAAAAIIYDDRRAWSLASIASYLSTDQLLEAVAIADAIKGSDSQSCALIGLAVSLPEDKRDPVLAQALTAAKAINDPEDRAKMLFRLAPNLGEGKSGPTLTLALAATSSIKDPDVLMKVASELSDDQRGSVLEQAVAAAGSIDDPEARAKQLVKVASELSDDQRGSVLEQAFAIISDIDDAYSRSRMLFMLAKRLPEGGRGVILTQAVAAANAIDMSNNVHRAWALTGLAPHLPENEREEILDQAVAAAAEVTHPPTRAYALVDLIPLLPKEQREPILAQAVAASTEARCSQLAAKLADVALRIPQAERGPVVAEAVAADIRMDSWHPSNEVSDLALRLSKDERAPIIAQLAASAARTAAPVLWADWVLNFAERLPEDERGPVVAEGVVAASAIEDPELRVWYLEWLVPYLSADQLINAATVITAIDRPEARARSLAKVARHLHGYERGLLVAQALTAATTAATAVDNSLFRAKALAELADLAKDLPNEQLEKALADATTIYGAERARILVGLAPRLAPDQIAHALTAAIAIGSSGDRAQALTGLAPYLSADEVARALTAAIAIDSSGDRAQALTGLAPHLPAAQISRALSAAIAIDDQTDRAWTLVELAPHLSTVEIARALQAAMAIDNLCFQAQSLAELVPHLPPGQHAPVLAQALAAAAATENPEEQVLAFVHVAPRLPDWERRPVLTNALMAAAASKDPAIRAWGLVELAPLLAPDDLARALTAAIAIDNEDHRAQALTGLAPYLPADEVARALTAVIAIDDEDLLAWALAELAPYLPGDQIPRALCASISFHYDPERRARALAGLARHSRVLSAAIAIDDPRFRAWALVGLAPHLPDEQAARALSTVIAINDPKSRAQALVGLAPHLPADQLGSVFDQALYAASLAGRESVVDTLPAILASDIGPAVSGPAVSALLHVQAWWP